MAGRCDECRINFRPNDKVEWCPKARCRLTKMRTPEPGTAIHKEWQAIRLMTAKELRSFSGE